MRSPRSISSLSWRSTTPSVYFHWRGAPALWSSLWASSGTAPTAPRPSCTVVSPKLDTVLQMRPKEGRVEGDNPLPLPLSSSHLSFDIAQDIFGRSGLQVHTAGSCPAFCLTEPPTPSLWGYSQRVLFLLCTHIWNCPKPSAALFTSLSWILFGSCEPTSQACPGHWGHELFLFWSPCM